MFIPSTELIQQQLSHVLLPEYLFCGPVVRDFSLSLGGLYTVSEELGLGERSVRWSLQEPGKFSASAEVRRIAPSHLPCWTWSWFVFEQQEIRIRLTGVECLYSSWERREWGNKCWETWKRKELVKLNAFFSDRVFDEAPEPSIIFGCLHANALCGSIMGLDSFWGNHKEKRYRIREEFCALESILSWNSSISTWSWGGAARWCLSDGSYLHTSWVSSETSCRYRKYQKQLELKQGPLEIETTPCWKHEITRLAKVGRFQNVTRVLLSTIDKHMGRIFGIS
jgi:hypothetical protein